MAIATGGKRLKGSRHAGRIGDSHKESPFAAPTLTNLKIEPHVAMVAQQLAMDAFNVVNVFVLSPPLYPAVPLPPRERDDGQGGEMVAHVGELHLPIYGEAEFSSLGICP